MNELIKINNTDITIKEFRGQRVCTLKDIDEVHQRPDGTSGRNFRENRERFIENEDFFDIKPADIQNDEIRRSEINNRGTIFLTESGYLMLVKSFTDDLAWEVQRMLVNRYFRPEVKSAPSDSEARLLRAKAMEMNAKTRAFKAIMGSIKDKALSPVAEALFGIKALGLITGTEIDYKPEIPAVRDLKSIAKEFGVPESCVSGIGKLVKARGIQTEEYTITVLTDVPGHPEKQVPQRLYKPEALPVIRDVCNEYLTKRAATNGI